MAKSKRTVQKAPTLTNPIGNGKAQLIEDLLSMLRRRMDIANMSNMSLIRLELMNREKAELLVELLEKENRYG